MSIKKSISIVLTLLVAIGFCVPVFADSSFSNNAMPVSVDVNADAFLVVNIASGQVVAAKNENSVYPIASVTKLMNAVVAKENINLNKSITLTKPMLKPLGTSPCLYTSLSISGQNLLQAELTQSSNDAANSMTYFLGTKTFIALMNQKAKSLGMNSTLFVDASGLSRYNHSSAADLVTLLTYIYDKHPEILSITKENNFQLPDKTGTMHVFKNVNDLYDDSDFVGAKAGYIVESKQTLASVALVNSQPYAIVILHSTSRQSDALNIVSWMKSNIAVD